VNGSFAPHVGRGDQLGHFLKADIACMTLEVAVAPIPLKKSAGAAKPWWSRLVTSRGLRLSRRSRLRHRDQFREFTEVLGSGCEMEFVTGAIRSSQAEAIELQNALQVGEQHLDLLPLAS